MSTLVNSDISQNMILKSAGQLVYQAEGYMWCTVQQKPEHHGLLNLLPTEELVSLIIDFSLFDASDVVMLSGAT